jgi:hypothetical protein
VGGIGTVAAADTSVDSLSGSDGGQDAWAVGGDGDGVLEVGAVGAVGAAQGPAVVVDAVGVAAAGQEPGLDGDGEAGL